MMCICDVLTSRGRQSSSRLLAPPAPHPIRGNAPPGTNTFNPSCFFSLSKSVIAGKDPEDVTMIRLLLI